MSIKLEWDVSEAPRDDEFAPAYPAKPPYQPEPHQHDGQRTSPSSRRNLRRGAGWLAALASLVVITGGGLWYFTHTGWQQVSSSVLAAVRYEDEQASRGAANLVLNVQDRGNLDWLALRRDEARARQPAPLPLPMLNFGPAPASVADLTMLGTQFMLASVIRQFTTPDGQLLTFTLPQFYRRDTDGAWLRSAPPGSFWGAWLDWHGTNLDIRYSARDADFVNQAAPMLDQRLADACAAWKGGCPQPTPVRLYFSGFVGSLEYNPLANVEVQVEMSTNSEVGNPTDYFLSVPSPQIAGIPADQAASSYLTDYLAVRLIASLARHISTSSEGYIQRTSQAIQALGLTSADPGYVASGQHRRSPPAAPQGNRAPTENQDRVAARIIGHTTAPGDTLAANAVRFSTSAAAIERANSLERASQPGTRTNLTIAIFNRTTP